MNRRSFFGYVFEPIDMTTSLLLHFDAASGSHTFTDSSLFARTVNYSGSAVVISNTFAKFGGTALYTNVGSYLTCSGITLGTQPFCIEEWIISGVWSNYNALFSYGGNLAATHGFCLYYVGGLQLWAEGVSSVITTGALALGTWHHIAIVGDGGANGNRHIQLYLNGTLAGTYAIDYDWSNILYVAANGSSTSQGVQAWTDEFRVSLGTQRYTSNFTPPTAAFTV